MRLLYHITDWPYAGPNALAPMTLQQEGFVHLSSGPQLLGTAERWYAGQSRVGVLALQAEALQGALRWEDLYAHGEAFPHLYGPIPIAALQGVARMDRGPCGRFQWPATLPSPSPLWEGPDAGEALIEPCRRFPDPVLPSVGVLAFFPRLLSRLEQASELVVGRAVGSAIGPDPVLTLAQGEQRLAVCSPGSGGPLAAVALEELVAMGCRRFVLCGGAGALGQEKLGALVLASEAVRDEGLSHHYLPPAERVAVAPGALRAAEEFLRGRGVPYRTGPTWSTDALYRETPARIARRKQQGCLTVEMEVASLLAVAEFRGVPLVPLLFCGDDLSGQEWDFRAWTEAHDAQERLFWLAAELALSLPEASRNL
jgi:uridine phosphorylase/uncharacterized protein (DUF952 family)